MTVTLKVLKQKQDKVFDQMAHILGALSSPVRIKLIHFLSQAPLTVEVLSHKIDQSVANTSMHLRKMLAEKVVTVETIGQKRLYSLHPTLFMFWERLQDFIQAFDPALNILSSQEMDVFNWNQDLQSTVQLLEKGKVILLDVRPAEENPENNLNFFKNYMHIPAEDLSHHLTSIPKNKKVLVICRGRLCALSIFTVNYLRENKIEAYRVPHSWFHINQFIEQRSSL